MAKIAISLPDELLADVERQREISGESRSEFFRQAAETLLRLRRELEIREQYVRAYQAHPETSDEVRAARLAAARILAEEPWDDETW